ncbi:MAG: tetratricopeptide repeat protein [Bacteroidota bacterium]
MKIKFLLHLVLLLSLHFGGTGLFAQNQDLQLANEQYRQQNFQAAMDSYEKLVSQGYQSKALYYNLGNCYFRQGNMGQSVLNYEKALLLAPKDKEVKENLAFVKSQLKDEIIALDVFPLIAFWQNIRNGLSLGTWTFIALLLFWIGVAGLIIWILAPQRKQRVKGFSLGTTALVIFILPLLMAVGRKQQLKNPQKSVVLIDGTKLHATPNEGSETLYVLFEGATVSTVESAGDWQKVNLANGYQGWVKGSAVASVYLNIQN